jgi:hypothetical protein
LKFEIGVIAGTARDDPRTKRALDRRALAGRPGQGIG